MKRISFLTVFFVCGLLAFAGPVDRNAAFRLAQTFARDNGLPMSIAPSPAASAPRKNAHHGGAPAYYVFNASLGRGFVIVSGDDRTVPVLGYSESGHFNPDSIPANMKAWLQGYADQIDALDNTSAPAAAPEEPKACGPFRAAHTTSVAPLLTSTWDQDEPYNNNCPLWDTGTGERCVTGCVATSMAQVMYYHKWPAATVAEIPATTTQSMDGTHTFNLDAIPAGTPIRWADMQDSYSSSHSDASAQAVAELMQYCGTSLDMSYGSSSIGGSGAQSSSVATALKEYFDYNPNLFFASRDDYTISQWDDLIINELENRRPVVYGGSSTGGGHSFVIDGYSAKDALYHVNWGWSGSCNGYFAISVLNPHSTSGIGASSSSDGYSMYQDAVIGVQPSTALTPTPDNPWDNMLSVRNLLQAETGVISCEYLNTLGHDGEFYIGYLLIDADGKRSIVTYNSGSDGWNVGTVPVANPLQNYYYYRLYLEVPTLGLSAGTYRFYPFGVSSDTSVSDIVSGNIQYNPEIYADITIGSDGNVALETHPTVNLSVRQFNMPKSFTVGMAQGFSATIANEGDEYNGFLYMFVKQPGEDQYELVMRTGAAIAAGATIDVDFHVTSSAKGTMSVAIATDENAANVLGMTEAEVVGMPEITVSKMLVSTMPKANQPVTMTFTATNSGDYYEGEIGLYAGLSSSSGLSFVCNTYVAFPPGETIEFSIDYTPPQAGDYVLALTYPVGGSPEPFFWSGFIAGEADPPADVPGDINCDGRADETDITALAKFISDSDATGLNIGKADLNGDKRINVADLVELSRLITNQ